MAKLKNKKGHIFNLFDAGLSNREVAIKLECSRQLVEYYRKLYNKAEFLIEHTVEKDLEDIRVDQKVKDISRIDRKMLRQGNRELNALDEMFQEFKDLLGEYEAPMYVIPPKYKPVESVGVLTLHDLHFNERVDLPRNKFNLDIAKERLDQYFYEAYVYLKSHKVNHIYICFVGDIINSDRRPDELLTNARTNAEALVFALKYFEAAISNLLSSFEILGLHSVVGNESRMDKDLSFVETLLANNYDYLLHEMLASYFKNVFPIESMNIHECIEKVIDINGYKLLLNHGMFFKKSTPQQILHDAKMRLGEVDGIATGHVHSPLITHNFSRGGGLPGANSYSLRGLNIPYESPSQNVLIIEDKKMIARTIELD